MLGHEPAHFRGNPRQGKSPQRDLEEGPALRHPASGGEVKPDRKQADEEEAQTDHHPKRPEYRRDRRHGVPGSLIDLRRGGLGRIIHVLAQQQGVAEIFGMVFQRLPGRGVIGVLAAASAAPLPRGCH